jgi:hypothetical protein
MTSWNQVENENLVLNVLKMGSQVVNSTVLYQGTVPSAFFGVQAIAIRV